MPTNFITLVALIGLVVIVASLSSGLLERAGIPQVALFLALGALIGSPGLGVVVYRLDSSPLGVIAVLSLVLVLFTDAVSLHWADLRSHLRIAGLILGP